LLADLEKALLEKNQHLPFEPPHFGPAPRSAAAWRPACPGRGRASAGAVRDAMLGAKIVDGRGRALAFGGQVMKNVPATTCRGCLPGRSARSADRRGVAEGAAAARRGAHAALRDAAGEGARQPESLGGAAAAGVGQLLARRRAIAAPLRAASAITPRPGRWVAKR
jgi:hypothetical protein